MSIANCSPMISVAYAYAGMMKDYLKNNHCDCQNLKPKRGCLEYKHFGIKINRIYKIHQNFLKIIQVYCDKTTDGSGWTVFQLWLGKENIFTLTLQGLYLRGNELRIDMMNAKKIKKSVKHANFHITNAALKYTLNVNDDNGTLDNALKQNSRNKFSTFESETDSYQNNCASIYSEGLMVF